ncbi:unnamed protein product [Heterotrigona itama]|uniref:alpha-glucosidase n=1 Tax=Heterotrigona itama TaxID=395501 RepID=A0A6V7HEH4_9HYME|nr:unnamed protein product [Heterotrigona itama]
MLRLTILTCFLFVALSAAAEPWYKNAIVYQIYPRSFKDSDGDGIGDLNGITSELEHVADIGADAIWLSPIYKSPQVDFGYDISNFTDIEPTYGTLADFDRLVKKAKSLGLKVILDFVPNHTSHQHPWFKESSQKTGRYDDFYVWHDAKIVDGIRHPPNNWLSNFQNSAWEWNDVRKQYYLHQFTTGQPDLNYRNATLRQEMSKMILTEAYASLDLTVKYYNSGSTVPFNFMFIVDLHNNSNAMDFKRLIDRWMKAVPSGKVANWVVGNHDNHRVASRFGRHRADEMTMLAMTLPGIAVIYNGDEIGMEDRNFTYKETVDPVGCNSGPARYYLRSRDPERTPYQWDNTTSAGFSTNKTTWLPVHSNYKTLNLKRQKEEYYSHYQVFKSLMNVKKRPVIERGSLKVEVYDQRILSITRALGNDTVIVMTNPSSKPAAVNISSRNVPPVLIVYTAGIDSNVRPAPAEPIRESSNIHRIIRARRSLSRVSEGGEILCGNVPIKSTAILEICGDSTGTEREEKLVWPSWSVAGVASRESQVTTSGSNGLNSTKFSVKPVAGREKVESIVRSFSRRRSEVWRWGGGGESWREVVRRGMPLEAPVLYAYECPSGNSQVFMQTASSVHRHAAAPITLSAHSSTYPAVSCSPWSSKQLPLDIRRNIDDKFNLSRQNHIYHPSLTESTVMK